MRPYRSALYIPASNPRALEKARSLPCDAIIFDLEDAVAPDRKAEALSQLVQTLATTDYGRRATLVRVNSAADLPALAGSAIDGVVLPKVDTPADLEVETPHPVWAMMETARAILNVPAIAAHPALAGMIMGTNDLERELRSRSRAALHHALSTCLLAARAEGRVILDGVFTAFRDLDGLRDECTEGRDMGFDGKSVIHPAQIDTANEIFAPSAAETDLARRQIEAHEAALRLGQAVAVVDGRIVENLHIVTARRTLELADAISDIHL